MKIVTKPDAPEGPFETGEFNNGDLYISRKAWQKGNRSKIYLYSCGMLIRLPDCNLQHNVLQQACYRKDYVNVTTKFSLYLNEYFEEQEKTIQQLVEEKKHLQHMLADWEQGERERENQT